LQHFEHPLDFAGAGLPSDWRDNTNWAFSINSSRGVKNEDGIKPSAGNEMHCCSDIAFVKQKFRGMLQ
jgi:hypothetical protein